VSYHRLIQDASEHGAAQGHDGSSVDLLSSFGAAPKWRSMFHRDPYQWRILSGKWEITPFNRVLCSAEAGTRSGESIAVTGSPRWSDFTLEVTFKLLSQSIKPPEGGVILFFLFKNFKNYYSCHFCIYKKKIEFIKRVRGVWTVTAEEDFDAEMQRDYRIAIRTNSGTHQCFIDGTKWMQVRDQDIPQGCVGIGAKYCDVEFSHVSVSLSGQRNIER